ncbi:hypothetical protein [Deinococcus altitudinis]|uniref:hypothetical protein n=1 Tax=Deinococcus altitudinis TaxID=468914 RepID=UPI00389193BF
MKNALLFLPLTAVLLAACGGNATPDPVVTKPLPLPAPAVLTAINGAVQNYSGGASTLKLLASGDYTLAESSSNPALASAPLSAAGAFSLALPSLAVVTPYLYETGSGPMSSSNCSSSIVVSDPTSQAYRFADLHVGNVVYYNGDITSTSTTVSFSNASWIYLTKPTTISGSYRCTDTSTPGKTTVATQNYNASLKQGWNILDLNGTLSGSSDGKTYTSVTNTTTGSDRATLWTALQNPAPSAQAISMRSLALQLIHSQNRPNLFGNTTR